MAAASTLSNMDQNDAILYCIKNIPQATKKVRLNSMAPNMSHLKKEKKEGKIPNIFINIIGDYSVRGDDPSLRRCLLSVLDAANAMKGWLFVSGSATIHLIQDMLKYEASYLVDDASDRLDCISVEPIEDAHKDDAAHARVRWLFNAIQFTPNENNFWITLLDWKVAIILKENRPNSDKKWGGIWNPWAFTAQNFD